MKSKSIMTERFNKYLHANNSPISYKDDFNSPGSYTGRIESKVDMPMIYEQ